VFRYGWVLLLGIAVAGDPVACLAAQPDLDPEALEILKATMRSISGANTFSFRVRVTRDRQATNDQLVTYFNEDDVTVSRPDKIRIDVDGEHHNVRFLFDGKAVTLFDPETKLYSSHSAPATIDAMLEAVDKQGIHFPIRNLLQTKPYDSLVDGLQTAYIIGRVNIHNKIFIHLVFTETAADWQLWVEPGDKPVPRAIIVIYKTQPGMPRTVMDFSDWNLDAHPEPALFEFAKPDDAHEIQFLPLKGGQ
jgi:hypothetical protein